MSMHSEHAQCSSVQRAFLSKVYIPVVVQGRDVYTLAEMVVVGTY